MFISGQWLVCIGECVRVWNGMTRIVAGRRDGPAGRGPRASGERAEFSTRQQVARVGARTREADTRDIRL